MRDAVLRPGWSWGGFVSVRKLMMMKCDPHKRTVLILCGDSHWGRISGALWG